MKLAVVLAAAMALIATPPLAAAHAMLERAIPRVGEIVQTPPTQIRLAFSESVEAVLCRVTLTDMHGGVIPLGPATTSASTRRVLAAPVRAVLGPGRYRVSWRAVSIDSHVTQGVFTFTVRP